MIVRDYSRRALIALGWALTCATTGLGANPAYAEAYAVTKRLPSDPPRIPLSRGVPVVLPDQDPLVMAKAIYARTSSYLGKVSGYRKAFMPDLARAMAQDLQPPEEAIVGFDWRYGGPAKLAEQLSFETRPRPGSTLILAHFREGGEERTTALTFFKRRTGWRLHDVSQTAPRAWSLRACLHMGRAREVRACDAPPPEPGLNVYVPPRTPEIPKPKS